MLTEYCFPFRQVEVLSQSQYKAELPILIRAFEELAHVYIIVQTTSDEEDHLVRQKIIDLVPEFPVQRCLVYSLEVGKTAIVRQVIPSIHIEYDRAFCEKLRPHVRKIIWVDGGAANVSVSAGLDTLDGHGDNSGAGKGQGRAGTSAGNTGQPQQQAENGTSTSSSGFATVASVGEILTLRMG